MVIRGITLTVSPARRLLPSTRVRYHIILDEKPVGRTMRSNWQQSRTIEGEFDLRAIDTFTQALDDCIRSAGSFSVDCGLVVQNANHGRFSSRVSSSSVERIRQKFARMLGGLPMAEPGDQSAGQ